MNTIKKTKNKLLLSVATLVMAIAITSTSTFAWFAMTSTPSIGDLTVNVTTDEGLLISVVPVTDPNFAKSENFKYSIASSDILTTAILETLKLDAVTPNTDSLANPFTGRAGEETFVENKDYLAFDIHFLSNVATSVSINGNTSARSTIGAAKIYSPHADPTVSYDATSGAVKDIVGGGTLDPDFVLLTKGLEIDALVSNSIRIGAYGDASKIYNPSPLQGWSTNNASKKHMANANYNALHGPNSVDSVEKDADHAKGGTTSIENSFLDLSKIKNGTAAADNLYGNLFNYFGNGNAYAGTARIYIWLEGTDADCFDGIFSENTIISMSFASVKAE